MLIGRFTGRLEPTLDAIICTNAFGMGIDALRANIRETLVDLSSL
jgi:hypothetical protein